MTLPDPNLDRPGGDDLAERDRLPKSQRSQDQMRTETTHGLAVDGSRPLTSDERVAAEHDTPLAERVYAPASERVPVDPVPGHRDFVEHTDDATPERQAAHSLPTEPAFTRVERPSTHPQSPSWSASPTSTPYSSPMPNSTYYTEPTASSGTRMGVPIGIGTAMLIAGGGVGAWLYFRWQRERNKPINRLRRQAMQVASDMREYVPSSDELRQPQYGAAASLLPITLLLWRMLQSRASRGPVETATDADWQKRLMMLKERWSPRRLELEKVSISRH
jgi:hypothetical protein